ncbi:MAG TPA: 8-oxo-dGTP diphosphatase MutT [Steroidobacteraceae bacterium]|nr:8-oxo-dGTP diphosphatase MutT [Steroidobacteraceae bacterium]
MSCCADSATAARGGVERAIVRVVAAALYDAQGRVLIAERPAGKHMAGRWEFPGGKIEAGETELAALARELHEELGIEVLAARPELTLHHDYPEQRVQISLWSVERYAGEPRGLDGQALKWVAPARLRDEDVVAADRPFIEALLRGAQPFNEEARHGIAARSP